jgi:hypothetical protein
MMTDQPSRIALPILVAEGHDLMFFSSEDAVGRYLEPWYPGDVECLAFDAEGRKLELFIARRLVPRRWLPDRTDERVAVRACESEPTHAAELAELLAEWLQIVNEAVPATPTLDALLQRAIDHAGYT